MSEAGNAALQTYSNGGVVLAGGIPPKIIKFLSHHSCRSAFCNKGPFKSWLQTIAVRICMNTDAPLIGAWAYGLRDQ